MVMETHLECGERAPDHNDAESAPTTVRRMTPPRHIVVDASSYRNVYQDGMTIVLLYYMTASNGTCTFVHTLGLDLRDTI